MGSWNNPRGLLVYTGVQASYSLAHVNLISPLMLVPSPSTVKLLLRRRQVTLLFPVTSLDSRACRSCDPDCELWTQFPGSNRCLISCVTPRAGYGPNSIEVEASLFDAQETTSLHPTPTLGDSLFLSTAMKAPPPPPGFSALYLQDTWGR